MFKASDLALTELFLQVGTTLREQEVLRSGRQPAFLQQPIEPGGKIYLGSVEDIAKHVIAFSRLIISHDSSILVWRVLCHRL